MSDQMPPYYPNPQNQPPQYGYPSETGPYAPPPNSYDYAPPNQQYNAYPGAPPLQQGPGPGLAIAGLILGIVSIVLCWIPGLDIILGIVGIILAALGRRSIQYRVLATVGLIIAIVGVVIGVCYSGFIIAAIISAANSSPSPSSP